jgi:hypothetical protein
MLVSMSDEPSTWSKPPLGGDDAPSGGAGDALVGARDKAVEIGGKAIAGVRPVARAVGARVRAGLGEMGHALRVEADGAAQVPAELLSQADLPELQPSDALASLAKRLDSEADFWRSVAMRQLARAAWTERLGVTGSLLLLIGGVVLAAIAAFRALFASAGGSATAMLVGVGLGVLLVSAIAVGRLSSRLRQGQIEAVRDALVRADLAEMRLHRIALLMEMRAAAGEGYMAALAKLEGDVRKA